jgi:hypothetical protein
MEVKRGFWCFPLGRHQDKLVTGLSEKLSTFSLDGHQGGFMMGLCGLLSATSLDRALEQGHDRNAKVLLSTS